MESVYLVIKMVAMGMLIPCLMLLFAMGYSIYNGQINKAQVVINQANQEIGKVKQSYQMLVQKADTMASELIALDDDKVSAIVNKYVRPKEQNGTPKKK